MFGSMNRTNTTNTLGMNNNNNSGLNAHGDVVIPNSFNDCISSVNFSPTSNLLVATSWSKHVRCWDIQGNGQAVPKAQMEHAAPVLCSAFSADGENVFTGSCDRQVKMWNLRTTQAVQVGQHDAPVSVVGVIPEKNLVVSGSWDRTLRYWDCRSPQPALAVTLPERIYCMDVNSPLIVVGTANRGVVIYNASQPQQPYRTMTSPLKMQTTAIACFPDKQGFVIASIEGRIGVQPLEEKAGSKPFAYKCHRHNKTDTRQPSDAYAVNSLKFNPMGTFASCGSDGSYQFWDFHGKQRLKFAKPVNTPITCCSFNRDGTIFAYALSYDWSRGIQYYDKNKLPELSLHPLKAEEITPRVKTF